MAKYSLQDLKGKYSLQLMKMILITRMAKMMIEMMMIEMLMIVTMFIEITMMINEMILMIEMLSDDLRSYERWSFLFYLRHFMKKKKKFFLLKFFECRKLSKGRKGKKIKYKWKIHSDISRDKNRNILCNFREFRERKIEISKRFYELNFVKLN